MMSRQSHDKGLVGILELPKLLFSVPDHVKANGEFGNMSDVS